MKKNGFLILFFAFLILDQSLASPIGEGDPSQKNRMKNIEAIAPLLRGVPVRAGGRVKPLETFTWESLSFISGRSRAKVKTSPLTVITWFLLPHVWNETPFILIGGADVKKALNFNIKVDHFSPKALSQSQNLKNAFQELKIKKEQGIELNPYFKGIENLQNRLLLYQAIAQGHLPEWRFSDDEWLPLSRLNKGQSSFVMDSLGRFMTTALSGDIESLKAKLKKWIQELPPQMNRKLKMEVLYNHLKPFLWAFILYLLGVLAFFALFLKPQWKVIIASTFFTAAFLFHSFGIFLRSFIMSRPPVTNMFETLLWVPWAALILAFVFARIKKRFFPILIGAFCCFFSLFLSVIAGEMLGDSLEPLEAVLRSNFWLSTHVLIITMSYSAFFLAFIMGDVIAFQFLRGKSKKDLRESVWFLYRSIQTGVLLLALGTILGGIWADYSWGRFWGWDPKEVWALVSLLGYLALLHAKAQGWVKDFGLAIGSIFCFFLIIMAWYGVNFVLGSGLHSYGFGQGGLPYVLAFIGLHLLFMFIVWRLSPSSKKGILNKG